MQDIEPYYAWRHLYIAEEDDRSPLYGREYSEFEYSQKVYNYFLHPQWDDFGSQTLYLKIIFADYEKGYCIIELIGEWNDALYNDIMFLKRDIAEFLMSEGIHKFILIGENVLNFHGSDDSYYEDWFQDLEDGWIVAINFREHVLREMEKFGLDYFLIYGGELNQLQWRSLNPNQLIEKIEIVISRRLN